MLYMNESKQKANESSEQDDLFGYGDMTSTPVEEPLADLEPDREPEGDLATPETLPLIQESLTPPPPPKPEPPKKAPLIFSARAPIPTRGGEDAREEEDTRRKRILEQTSREIPPLTLEQVPPDLSLGAVLTLARENAAYTVDAVSDITRISSSYILSFENDDFKRLPPYIYQTAYLREMCKLYKLPAETCNFIKQMHARIHNEHDAAGSAQEAASLNTPVDDRRATWIFTGIMGGIVLVIILAIWAVVVALVKHNDERESYQQQAVESLAVQPTGAPVNFDAKKLEELTPERVLDIRTLEMGDTGRIRE